MIKINKKSKGMTLSWRSFGGLIFIFCLFCLLLKAGGLAGLKQENKSGQRLESPVSSSFIKKNLLPQLNPEMAAVKRDLFRPTPVQRAQNEMRRPLAAETEPRQIGPASILESLNLSCLGLVTSGSRRMALILVDGQAVTLAEGEELIPGIRLAVVATEEIIFRDNQGNSRKVRIKER